jgi:hypothetical protein
MIQLKILSGKMAGSEMVARHFPFRIGRSSTSDLCMEEDGVWEEHLELAFDSADGFSLRTHPNALASLNGHPFLESALRNGDELAIGALRIRFWLAATRQSSLALREWLTWIAFGVITASQLALVYLLIQ